jgi:hypothetical protein
MQQLSRHGDRPWPLLDRARGRSALLAAAALLLLMLTTAAIAGPGHDHGDEAAPAAAGPALPRFVATSDLFEVVGVVDGKKLTLYLDHAATNEPVKDAKLELELGGAKVQVQPHAEGEFEATLAQELNPGVIPVTATVSTPKETDLLAGELDLHEEQHGEAIKPASPWKKYAMWSAGGIAGLAILAWIAILVRRAGTKRAAVVSSGGAA